MIGKQKPVKEGYYKTENAKEVAGVLFSKSFYHNRLRWGTTKQYFSIGHDANLAKLKELMEAPFLDDPRGPSHAYQLYWNNYRDKGTPKPPKTHKKGAQE